MSTYSSKVLQQVIGEALKNFVAARPKKGSSDPKDPAEPSRDPLAKSLDPSAEETMEDAEMDALGEEEEDGLGDSELDRMMAEDFKIKPSRTSAKMMALKLGKSKVG